MTRSFIIIAPASLYTVHASAQPKQQKKTPSSESKRYTLREIPKLKYTRCESVHTGTTKILNRCTEESKHSMDVRGLKNFFIILSYLKKSSRPGAKVQVLFIWANRGPKITPSNTQRAIISSFSLFKPFSTTDACSNTC